MKRVFITAFVGFVLYAIYYCWISFPVATGYGAKVLCSAVFVSGRNENDVRAQELEFVPLNVASYKVDYKDSSVTCTLFGFAKRKAIYRKGLGATLVRELTEDRIRSQRFRLPIQPSLQTDTIPWPLGDKLADTLPEGIDTIRLKNAVTDIFSEPDTLNRNRTRAIVIIYNNQIIAEKYSPGFTRNTRLTGWSMTKSVTSAITGILVKENKLKVDMLAPVPEWKNADDPRHQIRLLHLLQQTTGLKFEEVYSKSSHATRMLCQEGNMGAYAASLPAKYPPGERFRYSSGNSNILSRVIRSTLGDSVYHAFPYEHLFYELGMYSVVLEPDASGTFVGSSYCYATARDWARFGLLYLNEGRVNGKQLLPEGWVKQSVSPSPVAERGEYGYQWWLNAGEKDHPENRWFPTLPTDMFFADGFEGQNVFVIPSKRLVVVRLGLTRKRQYGEEEFFGKIIASVR